jgi:hypothetical protein
MPASDFLEALPGGGVAFIVADLEQSGLAGKVLVTRCPESRKQVSAGSKARAGSKSAQAEAPAAHVWRFRLPFPGFRPHFHEQGF